MAKALGTIAIITAGVALAFTGVGLAVGLGAGATGLLGAVSAASAFGFGVSASTLFLVSAGLTAASVLLQKAPKPPTTQSAQKQSIPPRIRAFGRSRLYAYFTLYKTAPNGSAVDTYAFMDGPADAIEQVYLNDDVVTISSGLVGELAEKKYSLQKVLAGYTHGAYPNTPFFAVASLISSFTDKFRGDGVVTGYLIKRPTSAKHYGEVFPQGDQIAMSLVARWGYQYDPRDPSQNIADNPTRADMWRSFTNAAGLPDKRYIGSWKWTENPALHLLWYLVWDRGYDYATHILPVVEYWKNAANVCDEDIPLRDGGTEPRYRCCVSYSATSMEKEVVASILETFDGWMQERGDGGFVIYAGKVYTPSVTIGPDEIVSINLQNFVETENGIDQVKVTYISAEHDYTEQEGTPWDGEGGAERIGAIDAATPSYSQNRRLAKRIMDRTNSPNRGSCTTTLAGRKVRGQRYINLNYTESGITFFNGVVEISKLSRNFETGGLDFEWIAVDPNIDAWNPATEQGYPAAKGDPVSREPVERPVITQATPIYDQSGQDSTGTRLSVAVEAPMRSDITWYLGWKKTNNSVWNEQEYTDVDPSDTVTLNTGFVPTDESIDLRAQYRVGDGRLSEYSEIYTIDTSTDDVAPDSAMSITLTNWSDTLDLVTDYIPRARSYRWRFYAENGTTLVRTLITSGRTVTYTAAQAAVDGARRAYIVRVAGVNGAGAGGEASTGVLTLTAPPMVTGVVATGGATNAQIDFDQQSGVAGYSVAYSTEANFNPLTQGTIQRALASPAYLQGLAAATFYAKVAAFDAWTDRPDLLYYSTPEVTFTITEGGGGTGGGGGGGGGGYCPTDDELILLANDTHDGPGAQIPAGNIKAGQFVWTQHEHTLEWGAHEIEAVEIVESDDVWRAMGFKATGGHKTWLSSVWNRHDTLGYPVAGTFRVVRITVKDAHTYICAGVLSHNIKQQTVDQE